jgi:hypothetical protein
MARKPPPLPEETLLRVMRTASIDGRLLLFVPGVFAVMSAMAGGITGALASVLAAGLGALELHGVSMLGGGDARGMVWLVRAQLLLMALILFYASWQMTHFDAAFYAQHADAMFDQMPDWYKKMLDDSGMGRADFPLLMKAGYMMTYVVVGFVTIVYQGLMARYYHLRRIPVEIALGEAGDLDEREE